MQYCLFNIISAYSLFTLFERIVELSYIYQYINIFVCYILNTLTVESFWAFKAFLDGSWLFMCYLLTLWRSSSRLAYRVSNPPQISASWGSIVRGGIMCVEGWRWWMKGVLKGQSHEIFTQVFFYQTASSGPIRGVLEWFWFKKDFSQSYRIRLIFQT